MANRMLNKDGAAFEFGVVKLYAEIAIGATGAPTLTRGKGIASVARTTNGSYDITLQDKYNRFLGLNGILQAAAGEDIKVQIEEEFVTTTKIISIFTNTVATPTDPSSGSKLFLEITLSNSAAR